MTVGLSDLIDLCNSAIRVGGAAVKKLRTVQLTPEQQDLLAGASRDGTFHVLDTDQCPYPLVKAGGACYSDPSDPAACARYLQAFRGLCERGYVHHHSGILFALTPDGLASAAKIVGDGAS